MSDKLPIIINGATIYKTPKLHDAISACLKLFDLEYKMFLDDYKKKTKDKTHKEIYKLGLVVVQDHDRELFPEEIKMKMYQNCCVFGLNARYPFIPDASTVRSYAREAAHITILWRAKKKIQSTGRIRRETLIQEAIKKYGVPLERDKATKSKIIEHIQKRDKAPRATIQKSVKRYLSNLHGER